MYCTVCSIPPTNRVHSRTVVNGIAKCALVTYSRLAIPLTNFPTLSCHSRTKLRPILEWPCQRRTIIFRLFALRHGFPFEQLLITGDKFTQTHTNLTAASCNMPPLPALLRGHLQSANIYVSWQRHGFLRERVGRRFCKVSTLSELQSPASSDRVFKGGIRQAPRTFQVSNSCDITANSRETPKKGNL